MKISFTTIKLRHCTEDRGPRNEMNVQLVLIKSQLSLTRYTYMYVYMNIRTDITFLDKFFV